MNLARKMTLSILSFLIVVQGGQALAVKQSHPDGQPNNLGLIQAPENHTFAVPNSNYDGSAGNSYGNQNLLPVNEASQSNGVTLNDCVEAQQEAGAACGDPKSTAGMSLAKKQEFLMAVAVAGTMVATVLASGGSKEAAAACEAAAGISGLMTVIANIKGNACGSSMSNCTNTCDDVYTSLSNQYDELDRRRLLLDLEWQIKTLRKNMSTALVKKRKCDAYAANVSSMASAVQSLAQTGAIAARCGSGSSSAAVPPTVAALTTGIGDCSNTSFAATSTYCICKANPSDALCGNSINGATPTGSGVAGGGIATPGLGGAASNDVAPVDTTAVLSHPENGKQATGNGGGGGGLGGGSGGGGPGAGPEGDGTAASGIDKNVITGASSGGGGLSALGGGGGSGGGLGRSSGSGSGGGGGGFNLSKYLPKSLFKNRGIAGMSLPATDGVTGPTGPTIWEKVHTRYEDKKSTLIQDK